MPRPIDVVTNETLQFVLRSIPSRNSRVLEVGCGNGDLAHKLGNLGHEVVAIDSSRDKITEAARRGVDARVADFLDFKEDLFDVILFTRSLHHIQPLRPALARAHTLIKPGGLIVVEDFAYSETNEYTASWFYQALQLLEACGILLAAEDTFGRALLNHGGTISVWQEHVTDINTAQEIEQAIRECFGVLEIKPAPYLFRYVSQMLPDDERGGRILPRFLELELQTAAKIDEFLIGRRYVARR